MDEKEIILNLWYLVDENGIIYSLRVRSYVMCGRDEDKLAFLTERAKEDYLIADPFAVPERFHVRIANKMMPVGHVQMLEALETPLALFEDGIKTIEQKMPAQTKLKIPESPLFCLTPLVQNVDGEIKPDFGKTKHFYS